MRIARIKGPKLGGWIIALFDLEEKKYIGFEIFILPGSKEAIARQLNAALTQFERSECRGIMQDLRNLCEQHGISVNPQWTTYFLRSANP
jgi:hypothetical protein